MRWCVAAFSVVLFLACGVGMPYAAIQDSYRSPTDSPRIVTIRDFLPAQSKPNAPERRAVQIPTSAEATGKFIVVAVQVSPVPPQCQYVHVNAFRSNEGQYCVLNIYMIVRQGVVLSKDVHIECRPEALEADANGRITACGDPLEAQHLVLPSSYTTSSDPLLPDQDIAASAP